jgi:hypothetical protein
LLLGTPAQAGLDFHFFLLGVKALVEVKALDLLASLIISTIENILLQLNLTPMLITFELPEKDFLCICLLDEGVVVRGEHNDNARRLGHLVSVVRGTPSQAGWPTQLFF